MTPRSAPQRPVADDPAEVLPRLEQRCLRCGCFAAQCNTCPTSSEIAVLEHRIHRKKEERSLS